MFLILLQAFKLCKDCPKVYIGETGRARESNAGFIIQIGDDHLYTWKTAKFIHISANS